MELDEYQQRALETDKTSANYEHVPQRDIVVALLGIAGELGTLATTYKKYLRDGNAYRLHKSHVATEIGDLLWYAAVLAEKFELSLSEIAIENLRKAHDRWYPASGGLLVNSYDAGFKPEERLPRSFSVEFSEREIDGRTKAVMTLDGEPIGAALTDNVELEDGYRFHDAFHLAFATVLGWSPVVRKLMGRKRRSRPMIDETQDGGRAIVIEEGVAALVFEYGVTNGELEGARAVDFDLIATIKSMTKRLEVRDQPESAWENAIQQGWKIFRHLTTHKGGTVRCDLDSRQLTIEQ